MPEFFIQTNSFAAPIFSDSGSQYVTAETPEAALEKLASEYGHPAGLYAAVCYASADAMHKDQPPLAKWLCNHELVKMERTKDLGCYTFCGYGPGKFVVNGEMIVVPDPKAGQIVI